MHHARCRLQGRRGTKAGPRLGMWLALSSGWLCGTAATEAMSSHCSSVAKRDRAALRRSARTRCTFGQRRS
eukprot:360841-Chlamydomonas_euryale.AAC.2